jgi:dipeptidyl aminopeptidase/acylaminoacyl peptidase
MKTIYIILVLTFAIQIVSGQDRIAENVSFKSGDETITGILVKPNSGDNLPAVVFQQGSGNFAFDGYENEAWGPHKFYIEDVLLEQGYAVLYCNKRGLGGSTGNWRKNDFYGRADDAYAAIEYLKTLPEINAKRIGVSGHSQGGWIAQIVAAEHDDIAFIICLAGPTVDVKKQIYSNDKFQFECDGYEGDKLEKKIAKRKKGLDKSYNLGKNSGIIGAAKHLYLIFDYDNDEVLKSIKCPTLLLFAEFDINVDPKENINHLNQIFQNKIPNNITVKTMPKGQHGFYKVENRCVPWGEAEKNDFDSNFQNQIKDWVRELNST